MTTTQSVPQEVAIQKYLGISPISRPSRISCFVAAIRDAREFTGRVPDTGAKLPGGNHGCWLGALGYMALLDQVGSCLKPKGKSVPGNAISKVLSYFSTLGQPEIDAIYALRCAFAHDYSLANVNSGQSLQHVFAVCVGDNIPLVQFPKISWSGVYSAVSGDNLTTINLEALGDLVELVCQNILALAESNNLEIALAGGIDELLGRYFFNIR